MFMNVMDKMGSECGWRLWTSWN